MKKLILILVATLISSNAVAEWTRVAGGDDDADIYIDLNTVRRNGDKVKLWSMQSFKALNMETNDKSLSTKSQWELDCKTEQFRLPFHVQFSGKKGAGNPISNLNEYEPNDTWKPIVPGTIIQSIFIAGCDTTIGTHKWTLLKVNEPDADNGTLNIYIDRSKIQRKGKIVTQWILLDFRSVDHAPKGHGSWSLKVHKEYDCIEHRERNIAEMFYSANMGVGRNSVNPTISPWIPIEAESTINDIWKMVCVV